MLQDHFSVEVCVTAFFPVHSENILDAKTKLLRLAANYLYTVFIAHPVSIGFCWSYCLSNTGIVSKRIVMCGLEQANSL